MRKVQHQKPSAYNSLLTFLFSVPLVTTLVSNALADWPQWGGPDRSFKVDSKPLADSWSEAGLPRVWTRPLGDGYSGISAVNGRLYTMFRSDEQESIVALHAQTGETAWEHSYAAPFLTGTDLSPGPGPHTTPLVVDDRVCSVGVTGILHCLDAADGNVLWSQNLIEKLGGTKLYRGYSSSLIAYRDTVLALVGGPGHAIVAFRLKDGKIEWQSHDFQTSHASPLLVSYIGQDQLIVYADKTIAALDPASGEILWQHPHDMGGGHIASMPVWGNDGRLFFSCAYGGGSRCLKLDRRADKTTVTEAWFNKKMRVHHSNVVHVDDYVYGSSGDFGPKLFTAINMTTGKIAWRERSVTRCSILYADGKFLILEENGQLSLATASPEELKIHSQVKLFESRAWTPPTLVGNQLFVRNRENIMAFELP